MPKLLNQLNHGELKLNSKLQFRNQKKKEQKEKKKRALQNLIATAKFCNVAKSHSHCEISQCC